MQTHPARLAALVLTVALGTAAAFAAADILSQLGITQADARETIIRTLNTTSLDYYPVRKAFKAASGPARAQLVEGVAAWARTYTTTAEFKAAYAKMRELQKPQAPTFKGTPEEEVAAQLAKQQAETKKALESMPPDMRKQMEATLKEAADAMNTPEMKKMMVDGERMGREQRTKEYEKRLQRWNEDYPEDSRVAIARRLQAFLKESADVDFGAKLEKHGSNMRFVETRYEAKPSEWKLYYRAGKETVTAARAAAEAWLKEIGR